jgi:hypothetical protein
MDVCRDSDRRPLIILYCGDLDPSGACMSEVDLPKRLKEYGGDHVTIKRIAITQARARERRRRFAGHNYPLGKLIKAGLLVCSKHGGPGYGNTNHYRIPDGVAESTMKTPAWRAAE